MLVFTFLISSQYIFAQDDVAAIKAARLASNAAIARHDVDGIAKDWLPDFVITRGSGISMSGRDTIIASWKALFKTSATVAYVRTPTSIIVGDTGIMAWETGDWTATNSYSSGGKYSAMWRKVDGVWKLQAELFVSLRK